MFYPHQPILAGPKNPPQKPPKPNKPKNDSIKKWQSKGGTGKGSK